VGVAADEVTHSGDTAQVQLVRPVLVSGSEGSKTVVALGGDATNGLDVDITRLPYDVAHDAADSGNPLKVGGRARTTSIAAVANDDRVDMICDAQGRQVVVPYALYESTLSGTATSTGTGDTALIAAQGSGVRIYVTTIVVFNSSTTNTHVTIKDGTTALMVVPAPGQGGSAINLPRPLRLTANTALNFASAASVTTMYCSAVGFSLAL
jgi:hypothetical protein